MYVTSTRSAVDAILAPDRLSELVEAPVRAARLRIKPGVSITVSLLRADTGRSAGWARLLWPVSRKKAAKAARRAAALGLRTHERDTSDGLLVQTGEVATDPTLIKRIASARDADLLGALEGNLLRYNPLRRLVARTSEGVVRVTTADQQRILALQDFASGYVPVPPQLEVPDAADTEHVSIQRFVGDSDLNRHHDPTATARAGAALAALHAAAAELPRRLRENLEHTVSGGENPALAHTRILNHLDPMLAARVFRLGELMPLATEGEPVLIHGDASPDQVLVDRRTGEIWWTDFDRARLAPSAVDLGSYLAASGPDAAPALLEGYAGAGGRVPTDQQLRQAVARSRLERLQEPLRHGDPHWRRRIAADIDLIEALLDAPSGRVRLQSIGSCGCLQSREAS
ncbi:phosphotransferase family protein [Actinomyces sp.]|uniref:phosphotransferase family protein n=1 Tax=Actinomyces sp. TaxID=29317 RepID=UPI0026DB61A9|nr:phosphotransferase [Actinomyces sp.]MDO4899512.1 phosphotransferase [Actinomyces sp.]